MQKLFEAIIVALESGESVVRIAVMNSTGSTPRTAGACMAVFEDGTTVGTIGGGTVEHASQTKALGMTPGSSAVCDFDLTNNDAAALGMVCGGAMTVLLDSMLPSEENLAFAKRVLKKLEKGEDGYIETLLTDGIVSGRMVSDSRTESGKDSSLFSEPLPQPKTVHFIGAGHVAQATARIASLTGYRVCVIDDREDFANEDRFPCAHSVEVAPSLKACLTRNYAANDHIVIMTRGHLHDRDVLAQALTTEAGYIGMIGSKKKKAAVYASLLENGFNQADLDRVHCPIGLSINAETPEEIAISIMAELIATR